MQNPTYFPPLVLAIGGHDPGGGAGIQADIESITANACHAATAISCLTVQDTCDVSRLIPVEPKQLVAQARAVLDDCRVNVIKIGLLGEPSLAQTLIALLEEYPDIPVILDPVLTAGGGSELANNQLLEIIRLRLLPLCTLITPNSLEARRLCGADLPLDDCARTLLSHGTKSVLITGTHEDSVEVSNRLYDHSGLLDRSSWERLAGSYHGSGCTLASAIAARLAQGDSLLDAVRRGQRYSWEALKHGYRTGRCQAIPNRLYPLRQA
jgi:hydroxymethylpyrimidine/phosphomethylpyrimidine kinase